MPSSAMAFLRHPLSTLKLSRWFSRSYRGAIVENASRTYAPFSAPPSAALMAVASSVDFAIAVQTGGRTNVRQARLDSPMPGIASPPLAGLSDPAVVAEARRGSEVAYR